MGWGMRRPVEIRRGRIAPRAPAIVELPLPGGDGGESTWWEAARCAILNSRVRPFAGPVEVSLYFREGKRARGAEHPHLYPVPRVAVGLELVRRKLASAAIDLSDGLSTDLAHVCAESRVGAEVWALKLPINPAADLEMALNGGEDYELLFTGPAKVKVP